MRVFFIPINLTENSMLRRLPEVSGWKIFRFLVGLKLRKLAFGISAAVKAKIAIDVVLSATESACPLFHSLRVIKTRVGNIKILRIIPNKAVNFSTLR
jgi:hypothetical protein